MMVFGYCFNTIIKTRQTNMKCFSFSMHVPIKNPKVPDNLPNKVACYNLEANLTAVNLDQMKYDLLGKQEVMWLMAQPKEYVSAVL